jgi:catechol 2,3-dioxygenase-like lactoylglutathione lyase family enzyme
MLGVRHVALRVKDLHRSLEFYTTVLKFKTEWHPDPKNVYLTSGSDSLALHQIDRTEEISLPSETTIGLDHFGFFVAKAEEVDEWAKELEERGIALVQKPKMHRDGARSLYFRDPDGNLIQILHHPAVS